MSLATLPAACSASPLSADERALALGLRGATIWFTGLPAAGKSTLAVALERALVTLRRPAYRLDGDELRQRLSGELGFSRADRAESVRRAATVAGWLADAGVIAVVALVSPYRADRQRARDAHSSAGLPFLEIHVATPRALCEQRDPKGLYARARRGELVGLTGVDDPYEPPDRPDAVVGMRPLHTDLEVVLAALSARGVVA